jgi:hypothetical protein
MSDIKIDLSQKGVVLNDGTVYASIRYEGFTGTLSQWSTAVPFTVTGMSIGSILPDGGIVFGEDNGDWLVVAPASLHAQKEWGLYGTDTSLPNIGSSPETSDPNSSEYNTDVLTSPTYNSINDGQGNIGATAAEYCRSLGYDLPNAKDLQLIYNNRAQINAADSTGNLPTACVWSSTEGNSLSAWLLYFGNGNWGASYKYCSGWVVPFKRIPKDS